MRVESLVASDVHDCIVPSFSFQLARCFARPVLGSFARAVPVVTVVGVTVIGFRVESEMVVTTRVCRRPLLASLSVVTEATREEAIGLRAELAVVEGDSVDRDA